MTEAPEDWRHHVDEWNRECRQAQRPATWRFDYPSTFERACRKALDGLRDIGTWGQEDISMPREQRESLY